MKEYQKEYEAYMKSITDGFAKLCSFEGAESILAGECNRVSVMIYEYKELLLEYDKDLKNVYRIMESYDGEIVENFHKKRQEVAEKFLNENTLTYDDWVVRYKTNKMINNRYCIYDKECYQTISGIDCQKKLCKYYSK